MIGDMLAMVLAESMGRDPIGDRRIDVRFHGDHALPSVVLLHGGPGGRRSVSRLAQDLSRHYRVLEPLQRRAGDVPLTVERHVHDLAGVAPDGAPVIGHSWGAMLALSYASRHPQRVTRLVLIGCGTYDEESRRLYRSGVADRLGRGGLARVAELEEALEHARERSEEDRLFGELARALLEAQSVDLAFDPYVDIEPDYLGHVETWADVLRLQRIGVEPAAFRAVTAPVVMLHGMDDPHPGTAIRDSLAGHVADLSYRAFRQCGHVPWAERAAREAFLGVLEESLA